ncbi:hypothetical protein Q9295_07655 [Xinfangfangia sp. CPCC 101601]|uniref:Glycosyltransferase n=1 Tax=Pseudogemmobacter lacusdianii TaxID=3069608 RepID=A0ABU0VWZ2_9RHOB|nr:hypothetical protein [Xinfangfangia sp. CPCC 101601]MDQ2066243.1 hypothetical protein [Xinfangfangia sp. CPCC 101601]
MSRFTIACASHSDAILSRNLALSPCLASIPLHVERNAPSAATAYNRALDATDAEVVIFAHHDVYLPQGWDQLLAARLAELEAIDPNWALYGSYGVGLDAANIGPVWSTSLGQIVGRVPLAPVEVQSYDELLIVLRRSSGLRFDEALEGWHFYGTDIVTQARTRGLKAWAGALPCIHNDGFHENLGPDYAASYQAMRRKWRDQLPLRSPIVKISRSGLHLLRSQIGARRSTSFRAEMALDNGTPVQTLAARCGWSDLSASA